MATNVVEGVNLSFAVFDREDVVPSEGELNILARLRESLSGVNMYDVSQNAGSDENWTRRKIGENERWCDIRRATSWRKWRGARADR